MKYLFPCLSLLLWQGLAAQVKIGENSETVHPASLLELESRDRVLVITRVTTAQMEAITPSPGALVYNTDQACLYYHNGQEWLNLCETVGLSFTSDPINNPNPTILITELEDRVNFEVGQIRGGDDAAGFNNIVDRSIRGEDIGINVVSDQNLAPNSVGVEEIQDNAVTRDEIDFTRVSLSDFENDVPFLVAGDLDASQVQYDGATSGLAADNVQDALDLLVLGADFPFNQAFEVTGGNLVLTDGNGPLSVPLAQINNQDIATDNTPGNISISNGTVLALNVEDADADPANENQTVSAGSGIAVNQTGQDFEVVNTAPDLEVSLVDGGSGNVTIGGTYPNLTIDVPSLEDADADPANELSDLDLTNNLLTLTNAQAGATGVDLSPYINTDNQTAGQVPVAATPANYFPASADVEGHLEGIDAALAAAENTNLANSDLVQTGNRTYDLAGFDLSFEGAGTVGIGSGVALPQDEVKLDVDGQIRATGGFAAAVAPDSDDRPSYSFGNDNDTGMFRAASNQLGFSTAGMEAVRIDANQNVGIGTDLPLAPLHVNGDAIFEGDVLVNTLTETAPDYVFQKYFRGYSTLDPGYDFMDLESVHRFVKENEHLPGIPSARDMQEEGVVLNKALFGHLEKIEELFLHTIEQEEKIRSLQRENQELSEEVESLQQRLERLERLLLSKGPR